MSSFTKGLTNKGISLQAKAQAGAELKYTKFVLGDGYLAGQSIAALTNVISPKKTADIARLKMTPPNQAKIGFVLSNQDISTGFYFRELGLYALDPDEGEILYWYGNAGETADYIPPKSGSDVIAKNFDILALVGQASNVTAIINESLVYATHDDVSAAEARAKAYTDQKVADIDLSSITPESIGAAKKTDFDAHAADTVKHITAAERTAWNGKADAKHTHDASDIVSGTISVGRLPGATAKQFGVCKLYDGVDGGPGGFIAASPVAVKQVYDEMMLVKQSVVDGKGMIAEAVNGKGGGPVSANNTFPELAAGINRINTGGLLDFGTAKRIEIPQERAGRDAFDVLTAPANANEVYLNSTSRIVLYNNYGGAQSYSRLSVRNQSGQTHVIVGPTASDDSYFQYFSIAIVSFNKAERRFYIRGGNHKGGNSYELDTAAVPPSDFNLNQNLTFYVEVYKPKTGGASNVMASVSSTKLMYV